MYDYMKALQKHFDCQEHGELDAQIEYAQAELALLLFGGTGGLNGKTKAGR